MHESRYQTARGRMPSEPWEGTLISKCPKCDKMIQNLRINGVDGSVFGGTTWKCITLCCPFCSAVLGTQIDPIAIKTDILDEMMQRLRKP